MEDAKSIVRNFNQSEVLHLLNHIFHTRDDVLFIYAMTRQEVKMDEENLKDFKTWLLNNRDIVMACIESSLPAQDDGTSNTDDSGLSDCSVSVCDGGSCSNAAGVGGQ